MKPKPQDDEREEHFVPFVPAHEAIRRGMALRAPPAELTGLRGMSLASPTEAYFADFIERRKANPPPKWKPGK